MAAKSGILFLLILYCVLPTSLYAQDFSLELMKCRASLDRVIVDAGPKYHKIKAQADTISKTIENLREGIKDYEGCTDTKWLAGVKRKVVCINISIKTLEAEIKKYSHMGVLA